MGLIIIGTIVFVLWFCLTLTLDKYSRHCDYETSRMLCVTLSILFSFSIILSLLGINKKFDNKIMDYNTLKEVIEYNRESLSPLERVAVIESIHENNMVINQHHIWCDNFWIGIWFSKDIAELEYLK